MVIQHNMRSLNANRMLSINSAKLAGTTEKLVSGYKINRAADDAAGLSISEKMRKRIRGLERGMENVEDGISLCQIADGALNEATELIQRMRELSIQAYNGTNSKSDRHTIQEEIDQSIKELDRTFETAKFNETYIFRNGTRVKGTAYNAQEYTVKRSTTTYRNKPAWLELNDGGASDIGQHTGYLTNETQYKDGIMKQDFNNGTIKVYFGPDKGPQGGYTWVGNLQKTNPNAYNQLMNNNPQFAAYMNKHTDNGKKAYTGWTDGLSDNVSAKISFEKLKEITDASDLYTELSNLVGVEIGFPCGTCGDKEAIRFGGTISGIDGMSFQDAYPSYVATSEINLSTKSFTWDNNTYTGYFDAIVSVMSLEDPQDKETKTKELADAIAKDLATETFNTLNGAMKSHFDRAIQAKDDEYSVYIYDYRDSDAVALANTNANASIITSGRVLMNYEETITTGYYTNYDYWDGNQVRIQASDGTPDGLSILDTHLSAASLGLSNYRVDTYAVEVKEVNPEEYKKELAAWNAAAPTPVYTPYKTTQKVSVLVKPAEYRYWTEVIGGETVQRSELIKPAEWKTEEQEVTYYKVEWPNDTRGPKPTQSFSVREYYNPSKLELLDKALATISKVRSYYGAVQNRLEHTYANNNNAYENITYAESQIRDTDMAEETVRNSMLNILQQAGLSMLAQANQSSQGVSMLIS